MSILPKKAKVVIIGGGIHGLSTAWKLSATYKNENDIVVLEKKNIALCKIDTKYSEIGTEVEVGKLDGQQKRIGAKVVPFPFYDPTKSRVRA